MLFGCIHVPDFPVQASLRAEPAAGISFQADPIAVLDGPESLLKVSACNECARSAGIALGMTKIQAEVCPGVELRRRIVEYEEDAKAALLESARSFSPRIESTCPGSVIVDLTGSRRLLGSPQETAQQLADRAAAFGFTVNVALAANVDTALHAARGFTGITVISEGEEAKRLAGLPVEVLEPSPEILDTFESWGIRSFQALAALPDVPLSQRLGQPGLHLQRLARGEVKRELVPAEPPTLFQERAELEEAVDLLEPLGFILNRLLDELLGRLQARSLATDQVHVDLELEVHRDRQLQAENPGDATVITVAPLHRRVLKLPVPTQDAKILLKLLQLDLAAHPPQAPVKKITVEAFLARVRPAQAGLFQPLAPEPAKLEVTLARLRAAVGEKDEQARQRVGFPMVMDSHRPDSFQVLLLGAEAHSSGPRSKRSSRQEINRCMPDIHPVTPTRGVPGTPDDHPNTPKPGAQGTPEPQLVMRWFRPPVAAWVVCNPVSLDGKSSPTSVIFKGMKAFVLQASGPWRSSGAWWDRANQWEREEWDVDLNFSKLTGASGLYRIVHDLQSGQWFVEGMYD